MRAFPSSAEAVRRPVPGQSARVVDARRRLLLAILAGLPGLAYGKTSLARRPSARREIPPTEAPVRFRCGCRTGQRLRASPNA